MSRYRKVEVHTWADEKFRSLTPIPPCGQGLWFFLLTGPFTGPIPGLYRAGRAAMAEELRWELEDFDRVFQELAEKGMAKADFKARLIWVPNALRYNVPASSNVVRGWRHQLAELPDCELKREAMASLKAQLKAAQSGLPEAWLEACGEIRPKPSPNPSGKAKPKNEPKPLVDPFAPVFGNDLTNPGTGTGAGTGTETGGDNAGATPLPAAGLSLDDQATFVMRRVVEFTSVTNRWATDQLEKQAKLELKKFPGEIEGVSNTMIRAWLVYQLCAKRGKLRLAACSAEKFFGDGIWRDPSMWGLKKGMKAYQDVDEVDRILFEHEPLAHWRAS